MLDSMPSMVVGESMQGDKNSVLAQKPPMLTKKRLRWLILLSSFPLFGMMAAFGIAPDTSVEELPIEQVVLSLELPETHLASDVDMTFWRQERIQRGGRFAGVAEQVRVERAGPRNRKATAGAAVALRHFDAHHAQGEQLVDA